MIHAYNTYYLDDVMSTMGAMYDYAVNGSGQEIGMFHARFLASGVADQIFMCNPKYLSGLSGCEMAELVLQRTGSEQVLRRDYMIDQGSPEYWTGWTLTYLQWYFNISFNVLEERGISVTELYSLYGTLHEADLSKTSDLVQRRLAEAYSENNPLKTARKYAGLTQEELATLTGNSLRSIRAYEQGQLSIGNAAADSISKICQTIGLSISSILPIGQ